MPLSKVVADDGDAVEPTVATTVHDHTQHQHTPAHGGAEAMVILVVSGVPLLCCASLLARARYRVHRARRMRSTPAS